MFAGTVHNKTEVDQMEIPLFIFFFLFFDLFCLQMMLQHNTISSSGPKKKELFKLWCTKLSWLFYIGEAAEKRILRDDVAAFILHKKVQVLQFFL